MLTFIIGLFPGAIIGFFTLSLLTAAHDADDQEAHAHDQERS